MTKRALLTGASGFVGANLARRLLRDGHQVHLLLRPQYQTWRIQEIRDDAHLHIVNMSDCDALNALIKRIKPEWIFHLAAHGAYSWQEDLNEIIQSNLIATINLVNACLKVGFDIFVNTGSSSEYGYKSFAPAEDTWLEPNSHYAITKASATMFCRYTANRLQCHIPTLRLYSVYGAYENPGRLMPNLILHGLQGKLPPLVSPDIARDYIDIDDVIDAYLRVATNKQVEYGAIYNVGSGRQTSLREVVNIARDVMKIQAQPQWGSMPARKWDTSIWVANIQKIRSELGWKPRYSFREGFEKMVEWVREHQTLYPPV